MPKPAASKSACSNCTLQGLHGGEKKLQRFAPLRIFFCPSSFGNRNHSSENSRDISHHGRRNKVTYIPVSGMAKLKFHHAGFIPAVADITARIQERSRQHAMPICPNCRPTALAPPPAWVRMAAPMRMRPACRWMTVSRS
jgi:hypothetical protein